MTDSIQSRIASTRAQLGETLDAIEGKFDVPQRASELARTVKSSYERNPVPWIIGATVAAIAVAGVVAWAILSNDD